MSVEVRIDQGAITRFLRLRGGRVERKLAERTKKVARIAEVEASAHGSMGDFVSWKIVEGPKGLQGVIVCDHPAVLFVLKGTQPHVIRPRRKKALRFEIGGEVIFAAVVHHPGTRADDFMSRALHLGR